MILSHIVAAAENNVIGVGNALPWKIPEDLKFFRDTTKGHIVIMGRKTFASVGRALPDRLNIVVSRQPNLILDGAIVLSSLEAALDKASQLTAQWGDEVFIIGGGELYAQSLPLVDRIYLTRVHGKFAGDAVYPYVDVNRFREVARRESTSCTFLTYERRADL
jgi:dihydrofolate reductase